MQPSVESDRVGDRDARFHAFVEAYRSKAYRIAWRLCGGDGALADDVVQDAMVRAYRGMDGFRDEAALSTWFYRILVRQAHNARRRRAVQDRVRALFWREPRRVAPAPSGDPVLRERLAMALNGLSQGQREAFVLVHLEGFTVAESAQILGKAPGTIKSHLHRAVRALRRRLEDVWPGGER